MARPGCAPHAQQPREQLLAHKPFANPLTGFPSVEVQRQGSTDKVQAALARRDSGSQLDRMERTLLIGANKSCDRIPTYSFFSTGAANYYGHTCREAERNPRLHARIIEQWTEEFEFEAVAEGIDSINSEIEAMGLVTMMFPENAPGDVAHRVMDDMDDEQALDFWETAAEDFNPFTDGRLPRRVELYTRLVERLVKINGWPVMAAPSAPFSQSVNAIGYKRAVIWMKRDPEKFHSAMAAQSKAAIKWFEALKSLGVTFFISIDAWNTVPNFGPADLYEFEKPYSRSVFESVAPTPVLYFYWGLRLLERPDADGNGGWADFLKQSADTGTFAVANLAPDYYTPTSDDLGLFRRIAHRLDKSYVVGLKDELILSGTTTEIRNEVRMIIRGLYPCDGGCAIVPCMIPSGTAPENIRAFTSALRDYGTYPIDIERLDADAVQ